MVINKYNELIIKYNNLVSKKNDEQNKKENNNMSFYKNNNFLSSSKNKINSEIKVKSTNNSSAKKHINSTNDKNNKKEKKIKNKEIKNISIIGNNKNINSFDNDYISHLKKENDILKNIIKTYKSINFNTYMKEPKYLYKKRNYFINKTQQIHPDILKKSINKNNSKERSYTLKSHNSKNSKSKNDTFNNPSIIYKKKKSNNSLIQKIRNMNDYSLINDSSLYMSKNRKASELSKKKKNFNTINSSSGHYKKNIIKKNNTYVSNISDRIKKGSITNKRMINKLKVKCKENIHEKNKDLGSSNNLSRDKIISRITPKNIIKNNGSFFAHTNYNIKKNSKNSEKIRISNKLEIDSNNINNSTNLMNNNDIRNNTECNCFYHDTSNNNNESNINLSQFNRAITEGNNYTNSNNNNMNTINNNLIIHRNIEHKLSNKFRLIKEFKTEKEKNELFPYTNKDSIFFNESQLSDKNMNKITINRKSILQKKSNISLRDNANMKQNMNLNETNDDNINVMNSKQKTKYLMLNKSTINTKTRNRLLLDSKNVNKILFNTNKTIIKKSSDKKQTLYQNKKIIRNSIRLSNLRNNQIKAQNKTINNINNFNNCSYIYLFNNGEKFIKINNKLKI